MRSCVLLLAAALGLARAAGPVFKQEAAEEMRVEHRTSIRGGETVHDYTKLEVEARLLDMLEDPSVVVKDRVLVEHKDSQQQDWAEVAAAPSLRGGVYRWTIADTVPCRDHSVRLTVFGEDGSRNTFYYPHTIVAPRLADIAVSGYRPATPGPVQQGVRGDGSMVLSWAEAACAASYEVIYSPIIGPGDTRSVEVEGTEVTLTGLASCQEYEVSVMVRVGWASVACGEQCSLYRRHPASDSWTTEATQLQVPAESCSEYIYAVTITVEEEVNTEELPVMILEEEANGFELKTGEVNTMCEVSFDTGGHVQTMTTFVTIKLQSTLLTIVHGAVISAPSFHACDPYLYLKYAAGLDCTLQFSFLPLYYNAMDNGILWSITGDLPDLGDGAP